MAYAPQGITCEPRERTAALAGLAVAFLVALVVCLASWAAVVGTTPETAGAGAVLGQGGLGPDSGTGGFGGGRGSGTGLSGTGPGAGTQGTGTGAIKQPAKPGIAVASPPNEPPKIGFTKPDDLQNDVVPPQAPPEPGVGDGQSGEGASGARGGTVFMGIKTDSQRVVYVIDYSGSMEGPRLANTKVELRRSIEQLPRSGSFLIVFFDDLALAMPPGTLVPATDANKRAAVEWMRVQERGGGTEPAEALAIALRDPRPDAIFLMTDGEFDERPVLAVIEKLNPDRRVSINTIAFYSQAAEGALKRIAAENHGTYKYVPMPGP